MQLLKITKGNYNTTKTIEQYLPESTCLLAKRIEKVNQNRNTHSKRRKVVTERYEKLEDLCKAFDALSPQEKTDRLFHFLYSFSHLDEYSISDCTDSDCTDSE